MSLIRGFVGWLVAGLAVGALLATLAPLAFGARTIAVLSGSMEPELRPGDAVISQKVAPLELRRGDVVTFPDPGRGGALVTHRLRSLRVRDDKVIAITKGDANDATERWSVAIDGKVGRAVYRLPALGYPVSWARGTLGLLALVLIPLGLIVAAELRDIWREPEERPRDASATS